MKSAHEQAYPIHTIPSYHSLIPFPQSPDKALLRHGSRVVEIYQPESANLLSVVPFSPPHPSVHSCTAVTTRFKLNNELMCNNCPLYLAFLLVPEAEFCQHVLSLSSQSNSNRNSIRSFGRFLVGEYIPENVDVSRNYVFVVSSAAITKELLTHKGSITGPLYSNHSFSSGRISASCQVGSLTGGSRT